MDLFSGIKSNDVIRYLLFDDKIFCAYIHHNTTYLYAKKYN